MPFSTFPAEEMKTRPLATAGVVNAPLLSCAVHSGPHCAEPQPAAGHAMSSP
jgi:hypothetical protein